MIAQALQTFDEAPSGVFRLQSIEKVHIPANLVVERITAHRKPPEVRIRSLRPPPLPQAAVCLSGNPRDRMHASTHSINAMPSPSR